MNQRRVSGSFEAFPEPRTVRRDLEAHTICSLTTDEEFADVVTRFRTHLVKAQESASASRGAGVHELPAGFETPEPENDPPTTEELTPIRAGATSRAESQLATETLRAQPQRGVTLHALPALFGSRSLRPEVLQRHGFWLLVATATLWAAGLVALAITVVASL